MEAIERIIHIRSDLSDFLSGGLGNLDRARVEEIAGALSDLNLKKPARMVSDLLETTDPSSRFEGFVKVIQTLRQVELRSLKPARDEAPDLVPHPMYGGLYIDRSRLPDKFSDVSEVMSLPDRFVRDYALFKYMEDVDDQTMAEQMEYVWGNASLTPIVASKLRDRPEAALKLVSRALTIHQKIVYYTAIEVCSALGGEAAYKAMKELPAEMPEDYFEEVDYDAVAREHEISVEQVMMICDAERRIDASGWEWLGYHFLRREAEVFRPDLLGEYEKKIKVTLAANESHINDLMASSSKKRFQAAEYLRAAGYPGFISPLRAALARETDIKVERELIIALGSSGDFAIIEQALAAADPDDEKHYLRGAYAEALAKLGDVRGKGFILDSFKEGLFHEIEQYGLSILPDFIRACVDPEVVKKTATLGVLGRRGVIPPKLVYKAVDEIMTEPVPAERLEGMLYLFSQYFRKGPPQEGLAMILGHASSHARAYEPGDQVRVVKSLIKSRPMTPLVVECWDDLCEEARLESIKLLKAGAKDFLKLQEGSAKDIEAITPGAERIVALLCAWRNDKAAAALMKAAASTPSYFIVMGDQALIELCIDALNSGGQAQVIASLGALAELAAEEAKPVIEALDVSKPKVKYAVEKAKIGYALNEERRKKLIPEPKKGLMNWLKDKL